MLRRHRVTNMERAETALLEKNCFETGKNASSTIILFLSVSTENTS